MARRQPISLRHLSFVVGALILGWLGQQAGLDLSSLGIGSSGHVSAGDPSPATGSSSSHVDAEGSARIERAFADRQSGFMTTVEARVAKTLPDDNEGSRHQRFLIELSTGRTLLVAHNIDLASRIPLSKGDSVRVHGQYEWNERGGVIHWTHGDPAGRHEGGWIEHEGVRTD